MKCVSHRRRPWAVSQVTTRHKGLSRWAPTIAWGGSKTSSRSIASPTRFTVRAKCSTRTRSSTSTMETTSKLVALWVQIQPSPSKGDSHTLSTTANSKQWMAPPLLRGYRLTLGHLKTSKGSSLLLRSWFKTVQTKFQCWRIKINRSLRILISPKALL